MRSAVAEKGQKIELVVQADADEVLVRAHARGPGVAGRHAAGRRERRYVVEFLELHVKVLGLEGPFVEEGPLKPGTQHRTKAILRIAAGMRYPGQHGKRAAGGGTEVYGSLRFEMSDGSAAR